MWYSREKIEKYTQGISSWVHQQQYRMNAKIFNLFDASHHL